jgi:hypothetical protein
VVESASRRARSTAVPGFVDLLRPVMRQTAG